MKRNDSKKTGKSSICRSAQRARRRLWEQLEERVLFDAVIDQPFPNDLDGDLTDAGALVSNVDNQSVDKEIERLSKGAETLDPGEIAFVDTAVEDLDTLLQELDDIENLEIVFLDPTKDGLRQIADHLDGREQITAIHILSHGDDGEINLGNSVIGGDQLESQYGDVLAQIGRALSDDGDILIYGCNFGQGDAGREAAAALAKATGADVAASDNLTGASKLGGDWDLEVVLGTIEAQAFTIGNYHGVLGTVISLSDDQGSDTADGVGNGDGGPSFDITEFGVDYENLATGSLDVHVQVDGDAGVESFVSVLFDIDGDLFADFDYMVTSTTSPTFGIDTFILYHGANDSNAFKISGNATDVATLDPSDSLPMTSTVSLGIGTNPFTGDDDTSFNMTIDLNEIVDYYNNNLKKPSDPPLTYSDVKLLNVATHTSRSPTSITKDQGLADASAPYAADDDGVGTPEDTSVTVDVLANDNRLGFSTVAVNTSPANGAATPNVDGTITYTPDAHFSGIDTFVYEALAIDGVTHTAEVTIAVAPVADVPAILAADASGNENAAIPLSITNSLVDLDGSESLGDITISGAAASLTFSSSTGAVTDNGGGSWTISQSALAGLSVTGTAVGTFNLTATVTTTDAADLTGDGDSNDAGETDRASAGDPFVLTISTASQPPALDLNGPAAGVDFSTTYTEGDPPVAIVDAAATLSDPDDTEMISTALSVAGVLDGASEVLTMGGASFSLGSPSSQTATVGGTTFLLVYDGTGGFAITNNAGGDMPIADLQSLMRGVTYENTSASPTETDRTVSFTTNDGEANSNTVTSTISVSSANVPPQLDLNGTDDAGEDFTATFVEGTAPVSITDVDPMVMDADDTAMASVTITPSGIVNGANEILTFHADGGTSISLGLDGFPAGTQQITVGGVTLDVAYDGTKITISEAFGGEIAIADVQAMLAAATYENATASAIPGDRSFAVSVNDGVADSNIATTTITVIPDYLSVAASKLHTNEDVPVNLGLTIDPDLFSGGALEDVVGVATGYRADSAGTAATSFTIPDNVTSIVITGYSNRPNNTAINDNFNDDYQILSTRVDLAAGTTSGTLSHIAHLTSGGARVADQYSWFDAELGTSVLTGSSTIEGDSASGTDPLFRIVGNTLEIVENHDLQTAYHVEFMTSNRDSTNYIGALSDVQQPGDTSSTFTIPAGTSYLVLTENAAAPGSNYRQEYKDYSRIIIDLDTMTASGTIAAERGETDSRTVAYSFEGYDISAATLGGILGGTSTATVVGDAGGLTAVQHSPNIYLNGSGELVVERTAAFATDFTSMYTIEAYQRTGFSSIAAIIASDADTALFDATAGTGKVNTLTFDVPASTKVGILRISMATVGGNDENENMGSGFAVIDLENGTSSGSFMNIRATTPDLVSWSDVPLVDDAATGGVDERVFFTDPDTVSNRTSLNQFVDGWGGTAWFDVVTNPDSTRTVTFNAVSDGGDQAYRDYQTHGQVTWLGNEPFRVRTGAAGGTFSHGSPVLDPFGVPTGEWDIDVEDIPLLQYIPDLHFAGDAFLEIELLSTGEIERIDVCVHPVADTPALTLADAPNANEDTTADLSGSIAVALVDVDGSETISLVEVSSIPVGFVLSDGGTNSFTATASNDVVDVTSWDLSTLSLAPTANFNGTISLNVRAQTTDSVDVGGSPEVDVTEATDTNAGETEASGSFDVTFLPVIDPPTLDLDSDGPGNDFASSFTEGGGPVSVSDLDPVVTDEDDTTMTSLTITPGGIGDGAAEILTITGDGVTTISFPLDGSADPLQQITIGGVTFDVSYDGTNLTVAGTAGEMPIADVQAMIAAISYENTAPTPTTGDRTLDFAVNDGDTNSNIATSTITVNAAAATAQWSLTGDTSVDEGGTANYTLTLDNPLLGAGEQASIDLGITDLDTTGADYADLVTAMQAAVVSRPDLAFNASTGTLTYTSNGSGPMTPLTFSLQATDDSIVEGPEDFGVTISNAASATGENISINTLAAQVDTTIADTQGVSGAFDQADWSVAGDASVDEGGTASYTIGLDQVLQAGDNATVQLSLSDIDTNIADYDDFVTAVQSAVSSRSDLVFDGVTGTLTFTSTGTAMSDLMISLDATDDTLAEGPELFQILLSNSGSTTGAAIGIDASNSDVTTTINDTVGDGGITEEAVWTFGVDQTVNEGDSGAYVLGLSSTLQSGEAVSVDLTLTDIDTTGADYASFDAAMTSALAAYNSGANPGTTAWDGTTFTFTSDGAGPMAALPVSLGTTNDLVAEGVEDFMISLSNAGSSTGVATSIDATQDDAVTTIDDTTGLGTDDVTWSVTGDTTVDEGGTAGYMISLSGIAAIGETATVELALSDIDTTSADYADFVTAVNSAISSRPDLSFDAGSGTLTFTSTGAAMADLTINLGAQDDGLLEGPEHYDITLSNSGSTTGIVAGINPLSNMLVTTINDTLGDGGPTEPGGEWSITGTASVDEGNGASYNIGLSGNLQSGESTSVEVRLADIETAGTDYADIDAAITAAVATYNGDAANNGSLAWDGTSLTFVSDGSGSMSGLAFTLGTVGDASVEGPERFRIDLNNPVSSTGLSPTVSTTQASVTTTIVDDEDASWAISGPADINEGATGQYTVSLSGTPQASEEISIDLGLTDLDTTSSDYVDLVTAITTAAASRPDLSFNSSTGTLTYTSSGSAMVDFTFDLDASSDALAEGPEKFRVELLNPSSGTGAGVVVDAGADRVTTTINDQTAASEWTLSGSTSGDEGDNIVFTVSLSGSFGATESVSVDLDLANIDTNSSDYGDVLAAIRAAADADPDVTFDGISTLTYMAPSDGASMTDLSITLPMTNDALIEGPEDFSMSLTNAYSATGSPTGIDNASITTTINDTQGPAGAADGPAQWSISGPAASDEGTAGQYTVALSGTFGIGEVITVDLGLSDIDTNSSDYGDLLAAIESAADANPDVTFNPTTGTLTYTAPSDGVSMTDLVIDLPLSNDGFIEGPEVFSLELSNATTSTGANIGLDGSADTVTTTINDTQGPGGAADGPAAWSVTGPTAGDEGSALQFTVALNGTFGAGEVVTVDLGLSDIDTNSSDYGDLLAAVTAAAAANPHVNFDPLTGTLTYTSQGDGASMTDLLIDLPLTDDGFSEGPEDFLLGLTNATTSTGAKITIDPLVNTVTTTINDTQGPGGPADGPAEWSVIGPTVDDEGSTPQYIVALSGTFGAGEVVNVDLGLTDIDTNSSDYGDLLAAVTAAAAANPGVTFDPLTSTLTYTSPSDGASMANLVIELPLTDDGFVEGPQDFTLSLTDATSSTGANVAVNATADSVTTTIRDTQGPGGADDGPAEWSISGPTAGDEGATATYTVSLAGAYGAGTQVAVDVAVTDVNTNSSDYADFSSAVTAAVDAYNAGSNPGSVAWDGITLTFTAGADGDTMDGLGIDLGLTDDALVEGAEQFNIALSNATADNGVTAGIDSLNDDVTTTINDTQGPGGSPDGPATWSVTGTTNLDEGATANYTVALSSALGAGEVVTVDFGLNDIDTNSGDYADLIAAVNAAVAAYAGDGTLAFNAATGTLTYKAAADGDTMDDLVISLDTVDDSLIEGAEQFQLALTNATSSTGAAVAIDVVNDDVITTVNDTHGDGGAIETAQWNITGDTSVLEGSAAGYSLSLSGQLQAGETAVVKLAIGDIGTNNADYAGLTTAVNAAIAAYTGTGSFNFNATTGELTYTSAGDPMTPLGIDLAAISDSLVEGAEDYEISISDASSTTGAAVSVDTALDSVQTTILGDDLDAIWQINGAVSVDEGAPATYTVSLLNTVQAGEVITVEISLSNIEAGTADYDNFMTNLQAGVDAYAGTGTMSLDQTTGTVTFTSAGSPMANWSFDLPINDDTLIEGPERYQVLLSNAASTTGSGASVDPSADDVLTTINDTVGDGGPLEGATWSIGINQIVAEGATASYTLSLAGTLAAGENALVDLSLSDVSTTSADYASFTTAVTGAVAAYTGPGVLSFDAATGQLSFTSDGNPMNDLNISLGTANDVFAEGVEDFKIELSDAMSTTGIAAQISATEDDVNTTIDDTSGPGTDDVLWAISGSSSVNEGAAATYTLSMSGLLAPGENATVDIDLNDIETNGGDYQAFVTAFQNALAASGRTDITLDAINGTVTFASSGVAMPDFAFTVDAADDVLGEGAERYDITLTNAGSGTGVLAGIQPGSSQVVTTINDDDPIVWSITGDTTVDEGTIANYSVDLAGTLQSGEIAQVELRLANVETGSPDHGDFAAAVTAAIGARTDVAFNSTTGVLTFTGDGNAFVGLDIDLSAMDDTFVEGPERYRVELANATSTTGAMVTTDPANNAVVTTINDTVGPGGVLEQATWSISGDSSIDEGATAQYTVSLARVMQAGETASVVLSLNDIEASSGDYETFTTAVQDALTASGRTDLVFDATTGTLTFTSAGVAMPDFTIDLDATSDALIEGPEDFKVQLSVPNSTTGSKVDIDSASFEVITTINDTDGPAEWSISGPGMTVEGATPQYTIALSGSYAVNEVVSVELGITDIDTTSADYADFVAAVTAAAAANPDVTFDPPTTTLTYTSPSDGASMTDLLVDLPIADDGLAELPEDYRVALSNAASSTGINPGVNPLADDVATTINGDPIPESDLNMTSVDTPVSGNVLTNDSDPDGDPLTVTTTPVTGPVNGNLTLNPDGSYLYTPNPGFVGTDAFEYEVCDSFGNCLTQTVTIEVRDTNDLASPGDTPPIASDDDATTHIDTPVTNDLLANDGDPDGDFIAVNTTPITDPVNGSVTIAPDGTYTYVPVAGFSGTDTFTYEIMDPSGNVDTATVTITVKPDANGPLNDAPDANDDVGIGQKNSPILGDLLANDTDPNGNSPTINTTPVNAPTNGSVVINPDGTYMYTPNADFVGNDSFTYKISDGNGGTDIATAYMTVFDNPPVAGDDINTTLVDTPVTGDVLTNDRDPNAGDDLTVNTTPVIGPNNGALVLNPDGTYEYTPNSGFAGLDSFEYEVCDEGGNCTTAVVDIEVRDPFTPTNDPPIAADDDTTTFVDTPVDGNVLGNDIDPNADDLTVNPTPVTDPTNGTVTLNPDGNFTYTPNPGFQGIDTFEYEVCDENGDCSTAVATIDVTADPTPGVNDGPTAADDAGAAKMDSPVIGDLLGNDSDPNGDPLTVNPTPITAPTNGTVVINDDGTYSYTPDPGFVGTDTFEYEICDDSGACSTATVTIEIVDSSQPNAPPIVNDESTVAFVDQAVTGSLTSNDGDPEGRPIIINTTPLVDPLNGTITINPDGSYQYTPNPAFTGTDTVAYEVCDADGNCDTGVLTVAVVPDANGPANDPPVAGNDFGVGQLNEPIAGDLLANDTDPNGDPLIINTVPVSGPSNGTLTINADGSYEYLPDPDFMGTDGFDYEVCDADGQCTIATVNLLIVSQPPVAENDLLSTPKDTPVSGNVLTNDSDADTGDTLTVTTTPVTPPANGTVVLTSDGTFTYTPVAGFTGVDTFDYEVCDDAGVCKTATVTIAVTDISITEQQVAIVPNGDNFDVTFTLTVENTGSTQLDDLSLVHDIADQLGPTFVSVTDPVLDTSAAPHASVPAINPAWSSDTTQDMLDPSVTGEFLLPNESFTLTFTVTVDPDATGTSRFPEIQATVSGVDETTVPTTPVAASDLSDSGADPNSTNEDQPGATPAGHDDPTPVEIPDLRSALAQSGTPTRQPDGTWAVEFSLTLENTGTVPTSDLSLLNDLTDPSQLGDTWVSTTNVLLDPAGVTIGTAPGLNPDWATDPTQDIFDGSGTLNPGESITVTYTTMVDPDASGFSIPLEIQATASGTGSNEDGDPLADPTNTPYPTVVDLSDSGTDPNGDNPAAPGDNGVGGTDDPTPLVIPDIGVAQSIISSTAAGTPGTYEIGYEIVVRNLGTVELTDLELSEDLLSQIGPGFEGIAPGGMPIIVASTATADPTMNPGWTGNDAANMFDGTSGVLKPGEEITLQLTALVNLDELTPTSHAQADATGSYDATPGFPGNEGTVSDLSDTGADPAGTNPKTDGDTGGFDDPTLIPGLGIAVTQGDPVAAGDEGQDFSVPITYVIQNAGTTDLSNLSLVDDLQSEFGPALLGIDSISIDNSGVISGTPAGITPGWPGDGTSLLDGTGVLAPSDTIVIRIDALIDPDVGGTATPLGHQAVVTASDPGNPGIVISDVSDSGSEPLSINSDAPGDTGTAEDVTPLQIADAGVTSRVTGLVPSGLTSNMTFELTLENTGTVDLNDLTLLNDLADQWGVNYDAIVVEPVIISSTASVNPTLNPGFVDDTSENIFDGVSGLLKPGEQVVVRFVVQAKAAPGQTEAVLEHQATGGGTAIDEHGDAVLDASGAPLAPVLDASDSGDDPNGNNPGQPGDTGGYDDPTLTPIRFFTFDSLNNFSQPFGEIERPAGQTGGRLLTKEISALAAEPLFSGTARPGTKVIGRVYDANGFQIGQAEVFADVGGNWMMQVHNLDNTGYARVEFVEMPGIGNAFSPNSDPFGYRGRMHSEDHYAALEPWTPYEHQYDFVAIYRGSASQSLATMHRKNNNPLGFGTQI